MALINSSLLAIMTAFSYILGSYSSSGYAAEIAQKIPDVGDIRVNYEPIEDETFQDVYDILTSTQVFQDVAAALNQTFALPTDIQVNFTECGEENAYYDSENQEISMCYELIQAYVDVFTDENISDDEYIKEVINAALFTFFHELGHALVDVLELPITGKEEDVVDEFAAIMLLQSGDEGIEAVLAGLDQFEVDAEEETDLEELAFWDEHSLNTQRFYNTACFIYGSNPEQFSDLVGDDYLPEERAELCEDEYAQKVRSWDILLHDYYQN